MRSASTQGLRQGQISLFLMVSNDSFVIIRAVVVFNVVLYLNERINGP